MYFLITAWSRVPSPGWPTKQKKLPNLFPVGEGFGFFGFFVSLDSAPFPAAAAGLAPGQLLQPGLVQDGQAAPPQLDQPFLGEVFQHPADHFTGRAHIPGDLVVGHAQVGSAGLGQLVGQKDGQAAVGAHEQESAAWPTWSRSSSRRSSGRRSSGRRCSRPSHA